MTMTGSRPSSRSRSLAVLLSASLALGPLTARSAWGADKPADKPGVPTAKEIDAARPAFGEGLKLEQDEKWSEAREKFELVAKVRITSQVRFHIALCEEHEGKLVEALRDFELAEADAKVEKAAAVLKEAPEHQEAIKARIPKLKVVLPEGVKEPAVTLDDLPIDAAGADQMSINPGAHVVSATADGRVPFKQDVVLAEGDSKTVTVKLARIPKPEDEAPAPAPEPPPPPADGPRHATTAYIVGASGLGVLALGGVFYLVRSSKKSDLDSACTNLQCPADKSSEISSGKTFNTLANVFGIVGVVGVGAGVVLFFTAPRGPAAPASASLRLLPSAPGADVAGLSLAGAF